MEEYKKYVDKQHVTEPMIDEIMKRIKQEEERNSLAEPIKNKKKEKRFFRKGIAFGVVAAVIMLVFGVSKHFTNSNVFTYTTVDTTMIRAMGDEPGSLIGDKTNREEMNIEEYELYTKMNFTDLLGENSLEKSKIFVKRENLNILEDNGTFYYKMDGVQAVVYTSKTKELIPEELRNAEVSQFKNMDIIVCKDKEGTRFYAYLRSNNINFCIKCIQARQKDFEDILHKFAAVQNHG